MDCCNYGEYRGGAAYGAGAWDGYGYAPLPHAPYAHAYYAPHAHDPYARYYRYDYPSHHMHHEHVMPMDYGGYASKEARVRRSLARREQRAHTPAQHLPLPPTPPLECGMNGRGAAYCEPQMWPHYQQMGAMGGSNWSGANAASSGWAPRSACSREHMRYPPECRPMKAAHLHSQNQACQQDGRSTPYSVYNDSPFNGEVVSRQRNTPEFTPSVTPSEPARAAARERLPVVQPRRSPPEEKRPPRPHVVPLPAFQQAFGSTEIGKFAEAFSRTEIAVDDTPADNFMYDSFSEWDGPTEPLWSTQPAPQPTSREIKCEDNF